MRYALQWILGPRGRLRLMLLMIVVGIVMTRSRMGNIAFFGAIFGTGLLAWLLVTPGQRSSGRGGLLFLGSLVVVDTLIVGAYFGVDRIVSRFQEGLGEGVQQGVSTIVGGRAEIATATLQMVRDFPLAGIGAGTFRFVFPQYRPPDLPAFATNVENDYLEFLVELGVIGCIPLVLIALLPVVRGVRLVRRTESQFVRGMTLGSLFTVIALSLHAFADFNLRIPSNAALLVISLALICAASALDEAGVDEGRMAKGDA